MPMSPRLLRPRSTVHPEAQAWATRVTANGGTVSASTLAAVSKFCRDIDAAGIRGKFYRLNLFCGDNLSAALVPLYRSESATASARGNATDTNNNFVSGDYNNTGSSSGLNGNGTTKFLNTGLPGNTFTATDLHLGIGLRRNGTETGFKTAVGAFRLGSSPNEQIYHISTRRGDAVAAGNCVFGGYLQSSHSFGDDAFTSPLATGNIVASRPRMYRNGVASGIETTASRNLTVTTPFYVFAMLDGASPSVGVVDHANIRLNWYSIGLNLTAEQVISFDNALNMFNTSLSRT